jgi:DNA polymerase-3 subunit gamma/tau
MAYLVLARKYRPSNFTEVVGQDHVTRTLRNAIRSGRLGHAFLFSGLRGVGKTSVARILAKTLNCTDDSQVDEPCNKCESCLEIDEGKSLEVVEMDAASHTGVDDIRELREAVMYAPGEGRHKVYIIDEVHMLSRNAFNALLKTLEEPPPRVVFILATTEAHRVPVTIHSRCQTYDFRRIPSSTIARHLSSICETEELKISDDSLRRIAIAAEGSLRDSQSLLDQVISFAGNEVSDDDVNLVLGTLDRDLLISLVSACVEGRPGDALRNLGVMVDNGADPLRIVLDLMEIFRSLLILLEVGEPDLLDIPEGELMKLSEVAAGADAAAVRFQFAMLSRGEERMRRAPQPRFHLELAVVHMARAGEVVPVDGSTPLPPAGGGPGPARKKNPSPKSKPLPVDSAPSRPEENSPATAEEPTASAASGSAPAFAAIETPEETWEKLVGFILGKSPSIGSMLEQLVVMSLAGSELVIGGKKGEFVLEVFDAREKKLELDGLVEEFFSREMKVTLKALEPEERKQNGSIVEKKEKQESDLNRKIKRETEEHQAVKNAVDIFDGTIKEIRVLGGSMKNTVELPGKEEEL